MSSVLSSTRSSITRKGKHPWFMLNIPQLYLFFGSLDQGYQSVKKWTSRVDIFSKKYIVVPINEKWVCP